MGKMRIIRNNGSPHGDNNNTLILLLLTMVPVIFIKLKSLLSTPTIGLKSLVGRYSRIYSSYKINNLNVIQNKKHEWGGGRGHEIKIIWLGYVTRGKILKGGGRGAITPYPLRTPLKGTGTYPTLVVIRVEDKIADDQSNVGR